MLESDLRGREVAGPSIKGDGPTTIGAEVLTLLMTDVEGSTQLWERDREGASSALSLHDVTAERIITEHGGALLKARGEGDSLFGTFAVPSNAVAAALELQRALATAPWPDGAELRVRIAIHTGEVEHRDGDLYGPTVNRCARIRGASHGGQVVVSEAAQRLAADDMPSGAEWLDLGVHRLRDLSRPERLFQLMHSDLPSAFSPLKTLGNRPNNLPALLTAFVGREQELEQIQERLRTTRLVTLTGPGGTGKTRLALQAACELSEEFEDGICFVDLVPVHQEHLVESAVVSAIGATHPGSPLELEAAVRNRNILFILDNCEQVYAGAAQQAFRMLMASPRSKVLATSRQALGIPGERLFVVPPMNSPTENDHDLVLRLEESDSGKLFTERARQVLPSFSISAENAQHVAAICRSLDGIPLAIELAASRLRALTTAQIRTRLQDRFALLAGSGAGPQDRHRTMRATLDWSFSLLSERERQLLASLSVFQGGWTLDAAETICATDDLGSLDVLDLLQSLIEKSMVTFEPTDAGEGRYGLLESVREYVLEVAANGDNWPELTEIHRRWYRGLIQESEAHFTGTEQASWFERVERELGNIRVALTRLDHSEAHRREALQSALSLSTFWIIRGHYREGIAMINSALQGCTDLQLPLKGKGLNMLGVLSMLAGELDEARNYLQQALHLRQTTGDVSGQAAVLSNLGIVERDTFHFREALRFFEEGVKLYRQTESKSEFSYALLNLGCSLYDLGRFEDAEKAYRECHDLMVQAGDQSGLSQLLANQADLALKTGQTSLTKARLSAAFREAEACGYDQTLADGFLTLARLAHLTGAAQEAAAVCGAATSVFQDLGGKPGPIADLSLQDLTQSLRAQLGEVCFDGCYREGHRTPKAERVRFAQRVLEELSLEHPLFQEG